MPPAKPEGMGSLHIAVPNYRGIVEASHYLSMYQLFHLLGTRQEDMHFSNPMHTILTTARQYCVDRALEDKTCTHVLFVDDDMVFGPDHYLALEKEAVENDLDFLGALAFANSLPTKPCIFGASPSIGEWGTDPWWHIAEEYPKGKRFEVYATGLGMVLMTTRMLRAMKGDNGSYKHFVFSTGVCPNEDISFCLNARKAGFRIWVHGGIPIGHISKDRPVIDEMVFEAQGKAMQYSLHIPPFRLTDKSIILEEI
jgi:hypothetical protein